MTSRTAENTVGRRLRSSSATSPEGSGIATLTSPGPAAGARLARPAASAAPSTGSSTAPRGLSARTVITRPRATISAQGFT